jgi:hypothetical protein
VSCPTCHGRLSVPDGNAEADDGGPEPSPRLFEQSDFEDYLRAPFSEEASRHPAASRFRGVRPAPAVPLVIDVERLPDESVPAPPSAGLLLTPVLLSVLVVVVILLLAGAFAAGIAVDRLILNRPMP